MLKYKHTTNLKKKEKVSLKSIIDSSNSEKKSLNDLIPKDKKVLSQEQLINPNFSSQFFHNNQEEDKEEEIITDILTESLNTDYLSLSQDVLASSYLKNNDFNLYNSSNILINNSMSKLYSSLKPANYNLSDMENFSEVSDPLVMSNEEVEEVVNKMIYSAILNDGNSSNVSYKKREKFTKWLSDPSNSMWIRLYDRMNPMSNGDVHYN